VNDIVLDTNILSEFLFQYFKVFPEYKRFKPLGRMTKRTAGEINSIVRSYKRVNLVVASTFAFLEISRQFENIVKKRFKLEQFSAFVDQPPEWFLVAPVDSSLFLHLAQIPAEVTMPGGNVKRIEWADAIHLATALSREKCLLATTDRRIKQVKMFEDYII
jgi:predicted nucleic acid-binding protein